MRGVWKLAAVSATIVSATLIGTAGGASALTITIVTPNEKAVVVPAAATHGGVTAFTTVAQHTSDHPLDVLVTP